MSRPRILITPAVFLSASIVAGSSMDDGPRASYDEATSSDRHATCSAPSALHAILARSAHVCHTR